MGDAASKVPQIIELNVPRDRVVAFALYTARRRRAQADRAALPAQARTNRARRGWRFSATAQWNEAARAPVEYPGWSAHFRVESWDGTRARAVPRAPRREARCSKASSAAIRWRRTRSSSPTCRATQRGPRAPRPEIVEALLRQDPDLLLLRRRPDLSPHRAHRRLDRVRPAVPRRHPRPADDQHPGRPRRRPPEPVGRRRQAVATHSGGADGGYFYPAAYVNMVQRQQTWHLPDPVDPAPVEPGHQRLLHAPARRRRRLRDPRGPQVQDRPAGKIPQMGPRPDHINDPNVRSEGDRSAGAATARRAPAEVPARRGRRTGPARR